MKILKTASFAALSTLCAVLAGTDARAQQGSELAFRDEFAGTALRPEWSIVAEDSDKWALTEGDNLIVITSTWTKETDISNLIVYKAALPENFQITTKMTADLNHRRYSSDFNVAFLGIQRDRDNRILLSTRGDGNMTFDKKLKGDNSRLEKNVGQNSGDIYLSLQKQGVEYEGFYSFDGSTWQTMGKQFFINLNGKPVLGGYNSTEGIADTGVKIDYFELTPR